MSLRPYQEAELRHWLVDYLVTTIGCSPDTIDLDLTLNELGVGSTDAVVLSGELSELLGRAISPVEFWQHPTINALAAFLSAPAQSGHGADITTAGGDRAASDAPIAVIGLGCRLPGGVAGPESLWKLLCEGRSAIGEVPPDRWEAFDDGSSEAAAALARTTKWGAFLTDIDAFDAELFDISPREAAAMDPQQRLLLEVACEALEDAGIPAQAVRGTQTGVFAGACVSEYGYAASRDLEQIDVWTATGGALSIIANRLSYFLDLRGPSVVVDTACSSSLVAIHQACQSLRAGESTLAVAAGVNLLLSPVITRSFDQAGAMSQTGRCRSFDAGADGFVRGEGCGVVVLKRLADAQRDGDRVLAVVRGSAVNQDGRSNGLMAPNPAAQIAVLSAACANAGIQPREIDYVEAHGTGTLLGDPIEARALGTVYRRGRSDAAPLLIGSVKTNLGHLEAAAGVAGFIKTVLAVYHGRIPKSMNFAVPNPHIPFTELCLKVVEEEQVWPSVERARRAGVSSFGFGGTNAHVVVESAPVVERAAVAQAAAGSSVCTLVVSGRSVSRVGSLAGVLAGWMQGAGASVGLAEVAHTLNHHRTRYPRFATVCAVDRESAVAGLAGLAAGVAGPGVVLPHEGPCGSGVVFVYSGQGSQWVGMGRQLLAEEPAFAAAVAEVEPVFVAQTGFSLIEVLAGGGEVTGIDRIQPVLVGVQVALSELWRAYGVTPDAVVGHSMGEISAAVVAGALSLADGLAVISIRSRLMARLAGAGAMALVELGAGATEELLAGYRGVSVAVYASPRQTVIAGSPEAVDAVIAVVAGQDRLARRIEVDVASHHHTVDAILPELRAALADVRPQPAAIPVLSTVTPGQSPTFDAEYWVANLRRPVRLAEAITAAAAAHTTFIEISPHPLLTHAITETLGQAHHHAIPTLIRDTHDTLTFHTHLNTTHTTHPPTTTHPPEPHPHLPTTPWHHTHHWITTNTHRRPSNGSMPKTGTLLGQRFTVSSTPAVHVWQALLDPNAKPYPGEHRLRGVDVVPVSVLLQTLLTAAGELGGDALSSVRFEQPITLDRVKVVQVVADGAELRIASSISAVDASAERWTTHVTAQLSRTVPALGDGIIAGEPLTDKNDSITDLLQARGVEGQPFGWSIASYTVTSNGLRARVDLEDVSPQARSTGLLDAATNVAALADAADSRLFVPAAAEQVWVSNAVAGVDPSVSVRRIGDGNDEVIVDIDASAADGTACLALRSLRYVAVDSAPTYTPAEDPVTFAHAIDWQATARQTTRPTGAVAVVGDACNAAVQLQSHLIDEGLTPGEIADARYVLYVADPEGAVGEPAIDAAVRISTQLAELVRILADRAERQPVTLWVLTTGVRESADLSAENRVCCGGWRASSPPNTPKCGVGWSTWPPAARSVKPQPCLATTLATPSKTVLVLRDGTLLAPELVPLADEPVREPLRCRTDAAYLVTGGLGALGLLMATWLADHGARRILLAGRTPLPPRREWDDPGVDAPSRRRISAIRQLEGRGVAVDILTLDIGSAQDVRGMLAARDRLGAPPVRGVIHAAGVTNDELLTSVTDASIREVMWPKVQGAQVLDEAFPCGSVDFFYLTASAASVFGVAGQGSYAAANAYLDALARARHQSGCHTVSLDWAAWRDLGFAAAAPAAAEELRRLGSRALAAEEAFAAWEYVHCNDVAQAVVLPVLNGGRAGPSSAVASPETAAAWSAMPADDVRGELSAKIRSVLARELHTPESELDTDRPFIELGLNSMMALSIRREIEQIVGLELSATMLWNHPTVDLLAAHLTAKLVPAETSIADTMTDGAEPTESVLDLLFDRIESAPAGTEAHPR